jgi:hypothetical protein
VIASYLIDASAWWHLSKNPTAMERWHPFLAAGAVGVISPTRTEILRSATGPAHRDELAEELDAICGVPIPLAKDVWRQVDTAQYRLTQKSQHRGAGPVSLSEQSWVTLCSRRVGGGCVRGGVGRARL